MVDFRVSQQEALEGLTDAAALIEQRSGYRIDLNKGLACGEGRTSHLASSDRICRVGVKEIYNAGSRLLASYSTCMYVRSVIAAFHEEEHRNQFEVLDAGFVPDKAVLADSMLAAQGCRSFARLNGHMLPCEVLAEAHGVLSAFDFFVGRYGDEAAQSLMRQHFEDVANNSRYMLDVTLLEGYDRESIAEAFSRYYERCLHTKRKLPKWPRLYGRLVCGNDEQIVLAGLNERGSSFKRLRGSAQDACVASAVFAQGDRLLLGVFPGYVPMGDRLGMALDARSPILDFVDAGMSDRVPEVVFD